MAIIVISHVGHDIVEKNPFHVILPQFGACGSNPIVCSKIFLVIDSAVISKCTLWILIKC